MPIITDPTKLEEGIVVKISCEESKKLAHVPGFLSYDCYINRYIEIALPKEIGRYKLFRFILED